MIELNITPTLPNWPRSGGVREHLRLLFKEASQRKDIKIVNHHKGVMHVESAYRAPTPRIDVYVCHGGFVPWPLPDVLNNLKTATRVISVSQWIVDQFFPHFAEKTTVIHNGIDLSEWAPEKLTSPIAPGYALYAKEGFYYFEYFEYLVRHFKHVRFVTTVWPPKMPKPDNVTVVGILRRDQMQRILNGAALLVLTGPEVCPTMLMEAWACSVPVLAQSIEPTGAAELMSITSCRGCELFSEGNLIEKFQYCLENSIDMGVEGLKAAHEHFSWQAQFEKYVEVYKQLEELR